MNINKTVFALLALLGCSCGVPAENANVSDPELFEQKNTLDSRYFSGIFPPGVKTIAVIAPGSYPGKPGYKAGLKRLSKSGLKVKVGKHVFDPARPGMTSAPVEARLEDFYAAWNDPEVDFILCVRGGEGCTELLNAMDWKKLSPRPELYLQGYSDVTQIICAMQSKKIGHPVAGPMVGAMTGLTQKSLQEMSDMHHGRQVGPVPLTPLVPGPCEGLPLAGHLERLVRSWSSPFPPETRGRIIFIEYVRGSEEKSRDLLTKLFERGFFKGASGVVFGQFIRCGDARKIDALLAEFAPKLGIPVYRDFPFGHYNRCYTIDFQRQAVIRDNKITFPAQSSPAVPDLSRRGRSLPPDEEKEK